MGTQESRKDFYLGREVDLSPLRAMVRDDVGRNALKLTSTQLVVGNEACKAALSRIEPDVFKDRLEEFITLNPHPTRFIGIDIGTYFQPRDPRIINHYLSPNKKQKGDKTKKQVRLCL